MIDEMLIYGGRIIANRIKRRMQRKAMLPIGLLSADYIDHVINMENDTNCG